MKTLEDAIMIAAEAHKGQKDKNGQPYILHPLRVMLAMNSDYEKIVAVMHDVVEDTDWTIEDIANEDFPNEIVKGVKAMTKKKGQSYDDYLKIVKQNAIARSVKLADIDDNGSPKRLFMLTPEDAQRLTAKYAKAKQFLLIEEEVCRK